MTPRRPRGVVVVGVLNAVLGAVGGLVATAMLRAARAPRGGSTATWGFGGPEPVAGDVLLAFGATRLLFALLAVISGALVLRGALAGRLLSLVFAWGMVLINVIEARVFGYALLPHALMSSLYPLVLIVLFNLTDWRRYFARGAA